MNIEIVDGFKILTGITRKATLMILKSVDEKNKIRLDVIHTALLRVSEYDKKLHSSQLEAIRKEILTNNFSFKFTCKTYTSGRDSALLVKVVLHPDMAKFDYYVVVEQGGQLKCELPLYNGRPGAHYDDFFSTGKWTKGNELVIWGKQKEVEIHILTDECKIEFVNLTRYAAPPYFTVMRADVSEKERAKALQDWHHSVPPAVSSAIRKADN